MRPSWGFLLTCPACGLRPLRAPISSLCDACCSENACSALRAQCGHQAPMAWLRCVTVDMDSCSTIQSPDLERR